MYISTFANNVHFCTIYISAPQEDVMCGEGVRGQYKLLPELEGQAYNIPVPEDADLEHLNIEDEMSVRIVSMSVRMYVCHFVLYLGYSIQVPNLTHVYCVAILTCSIFSNHSLEIPILCCNNCNVLLRCVFSSDWLLAVILLFNY